MLVAAIAILIASTVRASRPLNYAGSPPGFPHTRPASRLRRSVVADATHEKGSSAAAPFFVAYLSAD